MAKNLYTISPDAAFVDALADGLWRRAQGDPFKLSDSLILLPTRRACRHLREALLRGMDARAALLPHIQPLGDIDEEELFFTSDRDLALDISPAITPLRRQLLLAQLVRAKNTDMPFEQAVQLAETLARFLDQVQIERHDFSGLERLVQEKDLASHWQETVRFLEILTKAWPEVLVAEGCIDPADRRNHVLEAQAAAWQAQPPGHPVIAAGSTGTIPATADLLNVIASMPNGIVVLPGLDQELDEESWQAVGETHPQYGMKELLEKFEIKRSEVKRWDTSQAILSPRVRLLQESMRPAEVTEAWRNLSPAKIPQDALKGLTRLELDNTQEEAQAIALIMRAALEMPGKTAALVSSDRMLAERVGAALARWDIDVDDSAGASLAAQPVGAFLLDILAASAPHAAAVDYLSLLKHPLAACGLAPAECRSRARQVEIAVWRSEKAEKSEWLDQIRAQLRPMTAAWRKSIPLPEWLQTHIRLAEQLAASDEEAGAARLWRGEAGEAAAEWLDDWRGAAAGFPPLTGEDYSALFATLLRAQKLRPNYGRHPRLAILGPLEARLIQADLMILGGLNEGSWPPDAEIDPWMSRPMKSDFGLPLPERRIGLSAHDFVQLASAPEVVLTRAKRSGNAPTVPSRFILQLETVLRALGYSDDKRDALAPREPWQAWARMLDEPSTVTPCAAPEPRPPANVRPQQLSVTEIGIWRRNPYAIYAKHILKLKKLDPLDAEIDAADRGLIVHEALDKFIKKYPDILPENALDELRAIGHKVFAVYDEHPEVKAFWWPRFERIAEWFIAYERERRAAGIKNIQAEVKGHMSVGDFTLTGRADRIDKLPDGSLAIVDYKTGGIPTQAEVKAGYEPQLPLLALIAGQGGFEKVGATQTAELAYWKLSGGREVAEAQVVKGDPIKLAQDARAGLEQLIKKFADPKMPYQAVPKPHLAPRYDDYAHLARLAEWGRAEKGE